MTRLPAGVCLRDFRQEDGAAVSGLFRAVYGDHYVYPDVYLPHQIQQRNRTGQWQSAVAVAGELVVGHAALWFDAALPGQAEVALNVVHPSARGRRIATGLCRHLCANARAQGLTLITIKQVSTHQQTQHLARTLGFHTTALLLDYVTSPFGRPEPEHIVLGCLPLKSRPLPDLDWPSSWRAWLEPVQAAFGRHSPPHPEGPCEMKLVKQGPRLELTLTCPKPRQLHEVVCLPAGQLIYLKLVACASALAGLDMLEHGGFRFCGLLPDHRDSWQLLLLRGHRRQAPAFACERANELYRLDCAHIDSI